MFWTPAQEMLNLKLNCDGFMRVKRRKEFPSFQRRVEPCWMSRRSLELFWLLKNRMRLILKAPPGNMENLEKSSLGEP